MNKYILFYITMFTLLFMYSCKQDDFIQTDDYPHKIESKAISWQKFKELNSNTKQISDLIRKYVDVEDSIIGKTNEIDWRIDTTYVNQIISSNLVTYTFNVIENSEIEGFRNVIMRKTADEINVYLVHYPEGVDKKKKNARAIVQKLDGDLFLSKTKECYELEFKCQLCGLFSCNIKPGWVLVKVSCNDGGGSGGGDSGEWTPTNPIDEFDPDGGGPIGGGPGGAPQTPCEQLNKSSKDTRFKNKMDELKTARSGNKEKGFLIYNNMDKYSEMMSGDEYGNIDYGTQNVMKPEGLGGAHNHLSNSTYNHIAVFTPEDLCVFATIANYTRVPITDITHYVVSPEGIYAIKFATENPDNLLNFAVEYLNNAIFNNDVLSKYQENNIIHGKPKTAQEKGFLNVIKQYNLQIELYETDDNLQNWKKIELSANNELQYTPC